MMLLDRARDFWRFDNLDVDNIVDRGAFSDGRQRIALTAAQRSRQVIRWSVWPLVNAGRWTEFSHSELALSDWQKQPRDQLTTLPALATVRQAANECLTLLRTWCAGFGRDSQFLRERLGLNHRGLTLDADCHAVAIALHMTMCRFAHASEPGQINFPLSKAPGGIDRAVTKNPEPSMEPKLVDAYADVVWSGVLHTWPLETSSRGSAKLLECEIFSWFAVCLIEVARRKQLRDIDWSMDFPRLKYAPSWVVRHARGNFVLQYRTRAPAALVQRLIWRYANHSLKGKVASMQVMGGMLLPAS